MLGMVYPTPKSVPSSAVCVRVCTELKSDRMNRSKQNEIIRNMYKATSAKLPVACLCMCMYGPLRNIRSSLLPFIPISSYARSYTSSSAASLHSFRFETFVVVASYARTFNLNTHARLPVTTVFVLSAYAVCWANTGSLLYYRSCFQVGDRKTNTEPEPIFCAVNVCACAFDCM